MKRVYLTGATGFLGKYLMDNLKSIELIPLKRHSYENINWNGISGIIHCAGLAHNSHNPNNKQLYYDSNVKLTKQLSLSFENSKADFFIFISSSTIYDNLKKTREIDESLIGNNLSVYAESKLQAEQEIFKICSKKKFILRPCVIVGPNPKGNIKQLKRLVHCKFPIPIPSITSSNNLTDIRNVHFIIEYLCLNHNIDSGIFNVVDNERPNLKELLINVAKAEKQPLRLIILPNWIFTLGITILDFINPILSNKLQKLLFETQQISNKKISKIIQLPFNSFQ